MIQLIIYLILMKTAFAGEFRLIDSKDLAKNWDQIQIVIAVDDTDSIEFDNQFIKMNWKDGAVEKPGIWNYFFGDSSRWGKVKATEQAEEYLKKLGLNSSKEIVVVGGGSQSGAEGRVAWNLLYWGFPKVALLDGGYRVIEELFRKQILKLKSHSLSHLKLAADSSRQIKRDQLAEMVQTRSITLYDVRSSSEFMGEKAPGQARGGHIPGAQMITFNQLYKENGYFIDQAEFKKLVNRSKQTEIKPSQTPVAYCTGGVRSALFSLLAEAYLDQKILNYEASLWEWSQNPQLPMQK